jgi:predicted MFS family arabinose efflux permease
VTPEAARAPEHELRERALVHKRGPALAAFAALGFLWGAWAAIVPAVQQATGTSKGELGLALLCVGLGSLPAMLLVGPRIDRAPLLLPASLAVLAACAVLPGLAGSLATLSAALLAYGAASGLVDVAINSEVAAFEAATGRRSMQLAHALFSTGLLVGALLAGAARELGVGRVAILAFASAFLAGAAIANRRPLRRPPRPNEPGDTVPLGLKRAAVGVAALCACAFVVEGAIENWSALFLARDLDAGPGVSALGPAAYAVAMAGGRFSGQWLTRRFSDRTLLAAGGLVAVAGSILAAIAPSVPVALVGFFLGGAGVSVVAPIGFGAAGRIGGAGAIATVTTIGYLGFLAGPPIVGALAQALSLRVSFVLLAGLAAAIAAAASRVRLE